jgi:hypothetical protein
LEEEPAAKRAAREDDDILNGRRRWQRTGRQASKADSTDTTEKEEKAISAEGLNSEIAKDEAETIVPELSEAMEDEGNLVAEDDEEQNGATAVTAGSVVMHVSGGGGDGEVMYFEDSIQYLKEEAQSESDEPVRRDKDDLVTEGTGPEPNQIVPKAESARPGLVRVTSSSVERSAYNVVVNVLSDLVSTISD